MRHTWLAKIIVMLGMVVLSSPALASATVAALPSFADLVDELMPSVVNISTTTKLSESDIDESGNISDDASSEFRRYFENGKKQEALGSGFIIDTEGYIITNYHVISDAEKITVTLFDNSSLEAKLIGKDAKTDIALIKIDTDKTLVPVKFGDSDKVRVGDWILAIGNPFGLGGSVTSGIVSAKARDIDTGQYDSFIQTDASINQGSSGGPMFNMAGEVIGINSVIFSTNGASMGIGFAIPINLADWVIDQLKKNGEIRRGWIGIKIQPNDAETAADLGLATAKGVVVSDVTPDAPAQKSGLAAGDVILKFGAVEVTDPKTFSRLVAETPIGTKLELTVIKDAKQQVLPIEIAELDETPPPAPSTEAHISEVAQNVYLIGELGLKVSALTPELRQKHNIAEGISGMMVAEVLPDSDAALKGIKAGYVIVKADKKDVFDIDSFKNYINEAKAENNRPILLLLQDGEAVHFAALKLNDGE